MQTVFDSGKRNEIFIYLDSILNNTANLLVNFAAHQLYSFELLNN